MFGTNIRATVTTTVPNFVRGSVPLILLLFQFLTPQFMNNVLSAFIVGMICLGLSLWAIWKVKETFSKDLDYTEPFP